MKHFKFLYLLLVATSFVEAHNFSFLQPYNGCERANIYVGGNFLYTTTNLPQNIITVDYETFTRQPFIFDSGNEVITQKTDRDSSKWNAYIGCECPVYPCWLFGFEVGYRNLGEMETHYVGPLNTESTSGPAFPFRKVRSCGVDGLFTLRYLACNGFNVFAKGGFSWIRMALREGNFYSALDNKLSFKGPYAPQSFTFYNIYPEFVFGAGYRLTNCLNFTVSYGHIFGPNITARYVQEGVGRLGEIIRRPGQCPGYDFISVGIDIALWRL